MDQANETELFEYITDDNERIMLINAYRAITITNMWDFIKMFSDKNGFALSQAPELDVIYNKMEELGYIGHSGVSFAITLRSMQNYILHGEQHHQQLYIKPSTCQITNV